ncbi:MAG TPA: PKD domain-containing protein, partial [Thermoplasmatales archaeon]|nr:PKD domain-containing protein [Thermoplasmatales archaeon]
MKRALYSIVVVFGIVSLFVGTNLSPFIGDATSDINNGFFIEVKKSDAECVEITIVFPSFDFSSIETEQGVFTVVKLLDEGFNTLEGEAKLPKLRRMVEIPEGAEPSIYVTSATWSYISLEDMGFPKMIMPVQPSLLKTQNASNDFVINESYYSRDEFLPHDTAKILDVGEIRGHRFALIEISPVKYNPLSGELKIMKECEIKVNLHGSDITLTHEKIKRYSSKAFDDMLKTAFINYGSFEEDDDENTFDGGEGYLIIVYDDFYDEIMPLANWKENLGFDVTVTKTSQIPGGVTKDNIKNYIQDAYNNWSTPPSYVLLVGDTAEIPTWTGSASSSATDLYYVTMDDDDFADIHIGRFPASQESHVTAMVDKTVYYEEGDFGSDEFIKKAAFMASNDNYQISEGTHNYVINNYLDPNGYTCDKLYCHTYGATTQDVKDALNDGRSLAVYSGHGSTTSWADGPPFSQSDVNSLTNEGMYPFVCSHACLTGKFTVDECFGETWLRAADKAALAFWGSSTYTYWDEDDVLEKKMFSAWWDDDIETIGGMTDMAKYYLYQYYGGGGRSQYYLQCYNVLGDPSVKIWRDVPLKADFDYESKYPNPGDNIQFTDESVGGVTSWVWSFGDGGTSYERNPAHVYQNEGNYTVTLTVSNTAGKTDSISKSVWVKINWEPIAIAYPEHYAGNNPTINFDGSESWDPDGDSIVSYLWNFGDGETSNMVSPTHTFTHDGIYDVTLTVTDAQGYSGVDHCDIRIDAYTPPETEAVIKGSTGNNGWLKSRAQISLVATDWTGVDYTKYKIDDETNWHTYTGSISVWTNGYHTVSYYSVDVYGNTEDVKTTPFKIDTEKPMLEVELSGTEVDGWYTTPVTVTCSANDAVSGLYIIRYSVDGGEWINYTGPFMIMEDGEHVLR